MNIVLEDHFVENAQFVVLLVASLISFLIARSFYRKNKFLSICYLLFGIALFFIAGDEISWGQRILGFQTPMDIKLQNTQAEFTVHNLGIFSHYIMWISYMCVSIYGSFSWLLKYILPVKLKKFTQFITIPWFVSPYFIFSLIYHSFGQPWKPIHINEWSEVAELMMYLGIFFYSLIVYLRLSIGR